MALEYTPLQMAEPSGPAYFRMPALLASILPNSRIWEFNKAALNYALGTKKEIRALPLVRWPGCWYWRELRYLATERGAVLSIVDTPPLP